MKVQTIEKDGKPVYAVIPWEDYQALVEAAEDALDAAAIREFEARLAAGEEELIPAAVAHALLAGGNPVKVWREHRGLTQEQLAKAASISKAYLCQLETGKRIGAVKTLSALAKALGVALDDLR